MGLAELSAWLTANGASFAAVEPVHFGHQWGLGLRATKRVDSLEIVASVPISECVVMKGEEHEAGLRCARELADRMRREPRHPWFELLRCSDLTSLPMLWDDFEERLHGLSVARTVRRLHTLAHSSGRDLSRPLALVLSRAYWLGEQLVLAPLLDLGNHRDRCAYVEYGDGIYTDRDDIVLIAATPTKPWHQLFSTYLTEASNADTFTSFGFVDPMAVTTSIEIEYCDHLMPLRINRGCEQPRDDDHAQYLDKPRLFLADFVDDLAHQPIRVTMTLFDRLLGPCCQPHSDDTITQLRRDEALALEVIRRYVLKQRDAASV